MTKSGTREIDWIRINPESRASGEKGVIKREEFAVSATSEMI